jgi:hypothetical protein
MLERCARLALLGAVFVSAFLLFQIQPLVGKRILPWFGGTAAVWTTCLVVFQALLFCGYAHAHAVARLSPGRQAALHLALLLAASAIAVVPADDWKPRGTEPPLGRIVGMLLVSVGPAYFALAATGPLLQAWHWRILPGRAPYRLYALSNAGSLLALLSYPVLVEPLLPGPVQARGWRYGFAALVFLVAAAAVALWRSREASADRAQVQDDPDSGSRPPPAQVALWVGWSACGVVWFMAVTNQLTLDVAAVPFLWVLPLGLYLLAFVVAFSGDRAYPRSLCAALAAAGMAAVTVLLELDLRYLEDVPPLPILPKLGLYAATLFVACLVCHGELHRLRPAPRHLTAFYLAISLGGALGGITVGVIAPLVFLLFQELQLGMLAGAVLYLVTRAREQRRALPAPGRGLAAAASVLVAGLGVTLLAGLWARQSAIQLRDAVETDRSFFGLLRVRELRGRDPRDRALALYDGAIMHGHQMLSEDMRREPTTYFSRLTGLGRAIGRLQRKGPLRIGVVGLGAGTLAAYGRSGDRFRFYEINPSVARVARGRFTYLADSAASFEIALGDARLSLEREPSQSFDLLVLDAFSGDAVPVHLLTAEAFDLYARHLAPDGVIAANTTNLHLELSTIVFLHAQSLGLEALEVRNAYRPERLTLSATWMLLSRDGAFMSDLRRALSPYDGVELRLRSHPQPRYAGVPAWTDSWSALWPIVRGR